MRAGGAGVDCSIERRRSALESERLSTIYFTDYLIWQSSAEAACACE